MCSPVSRRRVFCSPRMAPAAIQSDKVTTEAGARPREYFGIRSGVFVEELTANIFDEENCNPCCGIMLRASAVLGITPKRSGSEFPECFSEKAHVLGGSSGHQAAAKATLA